MAWFKIDDGFHCHPKVFAAGTPAVGLYVRCGSWAAQQVTDGIVPKHVAKMYGTTRMIKALVDAGLWHQKDHGCESCPELDANSYAIHQYLEKNPSRAETDVARKAKSERQQRWREGKRAADVDASTGDAQGGGRNGHGANSEGNSNGVGPNTKRNSQRVEGEFASSWGVDSKQTGARGDVSQQVNRGDVGNVDGDVDASTRRHGDAAPVPPRPVPSPESPSETPPPPSPSTDKPGADVVPLSGRGEVQPLIEAMHARGMNVSWTFAASEWLELRDAIRRVGIPALVDHATRAWQAAKTEPYSAKYFLRGWTGLQDQPTYTGPRPVGAPSKTTEYLEDMAAIAEELRQKKGSA
ncbi:hypothetical protein ACIQ6R_16265 [Streptomyces sp. NPDC096048]|uniref:hypothetical protein n=1 Tax=Streptomyces sp. NPDC096048 TaxID=3366072 RepID=UPI00380AE41F